MEQEGKGPSIQDVRKRGEGEFIKSGRLRTCGRGVWGMRTSAKFWVFATKFDINLDKNC